MVNQNEIWTTDEIRKRKTVVFMCPECGDINSGVTEYEKGIMKVRVTNDGIGDLSYERRDFDNAEFACATFDDCGCETRTYSAINCAIHITTIDNKLISWTKHDDFVLDERFNNSEIEREIKSFLKEHEV